MLIKILVVDDSVSDRLFITNMLSEYCVLTASDGVEAMRVLEEHDGINLLILDLHMPNMNGFQVLEAIKEKERYQKLRTIIMTSSDELENEIKALKLGAIDFFRKPINDDLFKARINLHVTLINTEQALEQKLGVQSITFDMIFKQAPIGIVISLSSDPENSDESIVRVNSVYEEITGRTKEELLRLGWASITHPDDLEEDMEKYQKLLSGEVKIYSMDKRYIRPDGSIVWAHIVVAPLAISNVDQDNYICLIQDITERKTIEKALHESERSKSVLLSHLPGLAYRCNYDYDWTMQYVSKGCFKLTGYPPESLLYNREISYNDLIAPEYQETLWKKWVHTIEKRQEFKHEYEIITATGERKWVLEMGQGIYSHDGQVEALEGIILDISDRKKIENTLKYNNEHDRWTGLYNREYLMSLLKKDIKRKTNIKRALIGVNFSTVQLITANYGFQYTQNLIKKAAENLCQHCKGNCILFHERENRFAFYLYDYKDKNELDGFACAVAETLESLFVTERIGGGIGVVEIDENQDEVDIELIMRRLLLATERSVNMSEKVFDVCFYDDELEELVDRERDVVEALNEVAADDYNEDLYLQYQPIIDLKTDLVCGFEALSRLKTEKLGFVSPVEFIPVAEKTKLILPIGEKIIYKAFRFLKRLKEQGYEDIGVSINISIIQLLKPDFADRFLELSKKMEIDPKNIGIEITESVFAADYVNINRIIERLREAGVRVAIDDFGTGYSSLAREKELKVDCMKIDKYFIDKLLDTDHEKAITGDIISMSHKLGHCAIAEGVEYDIQLQYLKEHKCDRIQGFFISKPLDEDKAIEFLTTHNTARS